MTVYKSLGTDPSAYLNGRMLELYKDVNAIHSRAGKSNSITGIVAAGTIATGFTLSALLKDRGACFYSSCLLGPLIGIIADNHRQNKTPKKVKRYLQRRFGENFNESGEYQEILNLRKHIAKERRCERREESSFSCRPAERQMNGTDVDKIIDNYYKLIERQLKEPSTITFYEAFANPIETMLRTIHREAKQKELRDYKFHRELEEAIRKSKSP